MMIWLQRHRGMLAPERNGLAVAVLMVATLLSSCTRTLVFMEQTATKLGIAVNNDPSTPLEVTAGIKRKVLSITPPKEPLQSDADGYGVPTSEAVSLISRFDLAYAEGEGLFGGKLTIINAFASGEAARIVAGNKQATENLLGVTELASLSPDQLQIGNKERVDLILDRIDSLGAAEAIELVRTPPDGMTADMRRTLDARAPAREWQTSGAVARDILQLWFGGDVPVENYATWEKTLRITN